MGYFKAALHNIYTKEILYQELSNIKIFFSIHLETKKESMKHVSLHLNYNDFQAFTAHNL